MELSDPKIKAIGRKSTPDEVARRIRERELLVNSVADKFRVALEKDDDLTTQMILEKYSSEHNFGDVESNCRTMLIAKYDGAHRYKEALDQHERLFQISGRLGYFVLEDYACARFGRAEVDKLRKRYIETAVQGQIRETMSQLELSADQAYDYYRVNITAKPNTQEWKDQYISLLKTHPKRTEVWLGFLMNLEPRKDVWKYMYLIEDWYRASDSVQRKYIREHYNIDWQKIENDLKP